MRVVTSGVSWRPVSHKNCDESGDLWCGMVSHKSQKNKLKNWMLEQPVNNKGCSSIQFLQREFYRVYKKGLLSFLGLESFKKFIKFFKGVRKFHFLKYKNFSFGVDFFIFSSLGLKVAQVAAYITSNCLTGGHVRSGQVTYIILNAVLLTV